MKRSSGILRVTIDAFAVIGIMATLLVSTGLLLDVRAIDGTRGGYEPPYTDYTGTPFDWTQADRSAEGLVFRGRVVNLLVDCRSGMMTIEMFGLAIPWRKLSPRALVVHQPRKACREHGFEPAF